MKKKKDFKGKSKPRWQKKREQQAEQNSQFDPKIHQLSKKGGIGFGLRKDYVEKPGESSGSNLKDLFAKWDWKRKDKDEDTGSSES